MPKQSTIGKWAITEMSLWDKDYIDLIQPGCIEFTKDGLGSFNFGTVFCDIDYRISEVEEKQLIEFTFLGHAEGDIVSGRAKLYLKVQKLSGKILFHYGDESELIAAPYL